MIVLWTNNVFYLNLAGGDVSVVKSDRSNGMHFTFFRAMTPKYYCRYDKDDKPVI